jgi:hypothetical protein
MLAQQPTFRGAFTKSTVSIAKYILALMRQIAIYDKLNFTYLYTQNPDLQRDEPESGVEHAVSIDLYAT